MIISVRRVLLPLSQLSYRHFTRSLNTASALKMPIKVGDELPSVECHEDSPANKVNMRELFAGKRGVLFAVPGAFTPGCSKKHLPGYVENADEIKAKGVDVIACVSVNDAFVMAAWGESGGATGKIRMLADTNAEFTKAIDLTLDSAALGGIRSMRYSMIIDDGRVTALNVEPNGTGLTCSLSNSVLSQL
ncbi:peroxiredoxin-5, mitochondrial-like [Halichondria panicea]|uniref:peroxiredoxin-5, mitochondrial-like n=1 Tax=Halichondria panicea TaxID=6063 RepID=UPI00312B7563